MSDAINVGKNVGSLNVSPLFNSYAGVFVRTSDEEEETGYGAGDLSGASGRVLEFFNPWATQATANNVLNALNGWQYQPFEATDALADPAAEIGDGISINGIYSGIFTQELNFSPLMASRISAPQDEEITHEYGYKTQADRQYQRKMSSISSTLLLNAEQIDARVTKTSPSGQTSFGWNLSDSEWRLYSGNKTILRASQSGLEVYGKIEAESGHIGGANGFVITAQAIYKNLSTFGGTQSSGVYIGTNGIQLGQGFKVDSSGNVTASSLTAKNATLEGTLTIGGEQITARDLQHGAQLASSNGGYWSGGSACGYNFDSMKYGGGNAFPINASSFRINGVSYITHTENIRDYYGNVRTLTFLGPG